MSKQFIIFKILDKSFGISITEIKEIVKAIEIYTVPNAPSYVEGLINLRGKVHTVFNLKKRFYYDQSEFFEESRIIVLNNESSKIGLLVDEVNEIATIDESNLESTPDSVENINQKFIYGIAKINEKLVILLDTDAIISKEVLDELATHA